MPQDWTIYILRCADNTLYTGITNNLQDRLKKHENGTGAKYTKGRGPFTLAYTEQLDSRSLALKREATIKSLNKSAKLALCMEPSFPSNRS
ncbi:MAG: GIY-YIG nuclease family protein [Micavibrio sp.]